MHQRNGTPSKACSRHSRSKCPINFPCFFYHHIKLCTAYFIQITQRIVGSIHQFAKRNQIVIAKRFYGFQYSGIFRCDMISTIVQYLIIEIVLKFLKAFWRKVSKILQFRLILLQYFQCCITLRSALIILGIHQTSSFVRIANHKLIGASYKWNQFIFQSITH
ncbi:hypothetical protein D3C80_1602390 [compost metagenome]